MMNRQRNINAYAAALEWYVRAGVDEILLSDPINKFIAREIKETGDVMSSPVSSLVASSPDTSHSFVPSGNADLLGASGMKEKAAKMAGEASSLDELRQAIGDFDGMIIKKTATNMVFGIGNIKAKVMMVGEAPGGDEDRTGIPFVGVSGKLLDKMFESIGLSRDGEVADDSFYISNILNWRPPGNRNPSPAEIEMSLPFIERHIDLISPEILVFVGGVSAKSLLRRNDGISRMRKMWHMYQTPAGKKIPAMATFHPSYLLRSPGQKKAVWADMIMLARKLKKLSSSD